MKLTLKVEGADAIAKKLKRLGVESSQVVAEVTKINALEIEAKAKRNAPVGLTGKLQQNIAAEPFDKDTYMITAYEKYAPFIEFGTGKFVSVPSELTSLALKFIGKGIRNVNISPQPFLYPAFKGQSKDYIKDLNKALERLTNKFNK